MPHTGRSQIARHLFPLANQLYCECVLCVYFVRDLTGPLKLSPKGQYCIIDIDKSICTTSYTAISEQRFNYYTVNIHGHGGGRGVTPLLKAKVRVPLPARLLFSKPPPSALEKFLWDFPKNPPKIAQNCLKICKIFLAQKKNKKKPKVLSPP